jgi:hypothetical protein
VPAVPVLAPNPASSAPDPRVSVVHIGSSYAGTWLELRSRVDRGEWQRVCLAPCDRPLVVEGTLARVSAPGMTTSNPFRIDPGAGVALVRVDGGSAKARTLGILGLAIGIPVTLGGGVLYSYGTFAEHDTMRTSGAVVLGAGALAVLASLPFLFTGATTVRDGRGSAIAQSPAATVAF